MEYHANYSFLLSTIFSAIDKLCHYAIIIIHHPVKIRGGVRQVTWASTPGGFFISYGIIYPSSRSFASLRGFASLVFYFPWQCLYLTERPSGFFAPHGQGSFRPSFCELDLIGADWEGKEG